MTQLPRPPKIRADLEEAAGDQAMKAPLAGKHSGVANAFMTIFDFLLHNFVKSSMIRSVQ